MTVPFHEPLACISGNVAHGDAEGRGVPSRHGLILRLAGENRRQVLNAAQRAGAARNVVHQDCRRPPFSVGQCLSSFRLAKLLIALPLLRSIWLIQPLT